MQMSTERWWAGEAGDSFLNRICAHCANPMRGLASMTISGKHLWLCHPDEGLDCYRLVNVYGHEPTADCAKCTEAKEISCPAPL